MKSHSPPPLFFFFFFVVVVGDLLAIHIFHTHDNIPSIILECSIKGDNVGGAAIMSDL